MNSKFAERRFMQVQRLASALDEDLYMPRSPNGFTGERHWKAQRDIRQICASLGIPVSEEFSTQRFPWYNGILHQDTDRDMYHEIAHWLMVPEKDQRDDRFGLYGKDDTNASGLGILLHARVSKRGARIHAIEHNWDNAAFIGPGRWTWAWTQQELVRVVSLPEPDLQRAHLRMSAVGIQLGSVV